MEAVIITTCVGDFYFGTDVTDFVEFVKDHKLYYFEDDACEDFAGLLFQPTDEKMYKFLSQMCWDYFHDPFFHLPYRFHTIFDGVDLQSEASIIRRLLLLAGDVEENPGPSILSKPLNVNFIGDFRSKVTVQGFTDLMRSSLAVPGAFANFTADFSTFVGKIPDKFLVEDSILDIRANCAKLVDMFSTTFSKVEQQLDMTCANIDTSVSGLKKVLLGILAVLLVWFLIAKVGLCNTLGATLLGFVATYFEVFTNIERCILDNGVNFWNYLGITVTRKVSVEGFQMEIAQALLDSKNANVVFSAIFTSLFVYTIKTSPSTRDLEDLSRKVFNYQRGVTSIITSFDKISEFWTYMMETLSHKLGLKVGEGKINQWTTICKVNQWITANELLFQSGFADDLAYDERKERRRRLMNQYNEGIDYINVSRFLDKATAMVIQQWNQKIARKVEQMSTEALNGEMRNPPTVMLLYGRSGVGKTSMCDGIKALSAAVISDVTGLDRTSPANVYVRNADMDHWDGYQGQQFVLFDDLGCRKDTEANPNNELAELIHAKNSQPFPLPMAHLEDKGKYFTSQFIFCTTNIQNMADYVKSMTYPEAIVTRLSELPYIVRVKPQYRKEMTAAEIASLASKQIHDQHSVDKERARYVIDDTLMRQRFPDLTWGEKDLTRSLTRDQFESVKPHDILRTADGEPQIVNYHIYYFEPMDVRTGKACGPPIEWSELCAMVEAEIRTRLGRGENLLKQQRAFHNSTLEDIRAGKITVQTQMVNDDDDFHDARSFFVNRANDVFYVAQNYSYFGAIVNEHRHPEMQKFLDFYGEDFEDEVINLLLPDTPVDQEVEILHSRWASIFQRSKTGYEKVREIVTSDPVIKALKIGGFVLGWMGVMVGIVKATEYLTDKMMPKKLVDVKNAVVDHIKTSTAHLPWWKRLFPDCGTIFNPVQISRGAFPLTQQEIFAIYEAYNLAVVQVEGSGPEDKYVKQDQARRQRRLVARVPTAGFQIDALRADLDDKFKNVKVQGIDEHLQIEFDESLIHPILVAVQSHQLTNEALSHVLPANTYMMDYVDVYGKTQSVGNVTFLHDRALLMPYHYVQRLQHDKTLKCSLRDDCEFIFSRSPTHLELGKNAPANKLRCTYANMQNFQRIVAPVYLDDVASMEKDAVVVYLTGSGVSGHNCANIIKKFIPREELSKVCSSGLTGYMVVQRNLGAKMNEASVVKERVVLGCSNINPVNKMRRTASNWLAREAVDFQGEQAIRDKNGNLHNYFITLRDRYEYVANTQAGDCGACLWVDHPQINHCIIGMHSTNHPQEGKGCSVPITREDIEEALAKLGQCKVHAFREPELTPLVEEDVFGAHQLVPIGNFQYIGKLDPSIAPMQPMKTSILPSPVQQHLDLMKETYAMRSGEEYNIEVLKAPAVFRTQYDNPDGCRLFEQQGKVWFQREGEQARVCSLGDYQVWEKLGGVKKDPLIKGLAKASQELPRIRQDLIEKAVQAVSQKMIKRYNPLCADVFSKAMAQNNFYITDDMRERVLEEQQRCERISTLLQNEWKGKRILKFDIHNASELLLRQTTLTKHELLVLKNAIAAGYKGPQGLDDLLLDFASSSRYVNVDMLNVDSPNPMILTIEQSVQGIEGDAFISSINAKKSPGFPYTAQRKPFGKKWWVGKEIKCDGPGWPQLKKDVEDLIETCKTEIPLVYFVDTMKDELRPKEKVAAFKTRIFSAGPMHFSIAFRMYFMRFLAFIMENKIDNESAIGINPYSNDWEKLANYLSKWDGPTCIAGDYSNFDGSLSNQVMEQLIDIVEDFYVQFHTSTDPRYLEEKTIRKNMWLALTRSLHICRGGGVLRWYNSQASGSPITTFINIGYNCTAMRIVYMLIFGEGTDQDLKHVFPDGFGFLGPPPRRTMGDFEDDIQFVAYGDDNCANINPDIIDWFNMDTISRAMSIIGLTYTDEFKNANGQQQKARFLHEINFLKRGFRRVEQNGRTWVAPLDIDTVKEIPLWVRSSDSVRRDETMIDNVKMTCMEMALHGEEAYKKWVLFLQGMRHPSILGDMFPYIDTYHDQFINVCKEV